MRRLLFLLLLVSVVVNLWLWIALARARRESAAAHGAAAKSSGQVSLVGEAEVVTAGNAAGAPDASEREIARLRNENTLLRQKIKESTPAPPRAFRRLPANADINEKFMEATNALASSEKWAQEEYDKRSTLIAELAEATPEQLANIKKRAESKQCIQNLKRVGLAARIYGNENNEKAPPDYWSMRNELGSPEILFCPSAPGGVQARDWQQFNPGSATYAWRGAAVDMRNPESVFTVCPYHGHTAMGDGSVQSQSGQMPDL